MKKLIINIPKNKLNHAVVSSFSPDTLGFKEPAIQQDYTGCRVSLYEKSKILYFHITKDQLNTEKSIVRELIADNIKTITFVGRGKGTGPSNSKGFVILDHVNMSGLNPLRGVNNERYGVRFPDMSNTYQNDFDDNKIFHTGLEKAKLLIPKNIEKLSELEKDALQKNRELQVLSDETYFGVITAKQAGCHINSIILKEPADIHSLFS